MNKLHSDWYESHDKNHFWMKYRFDFFCNLINKKKIFIGRDDRCLDLGSGSGILGYQLEQKFKCTVDCADITKKYFKFNSKKDGFFYELNFLKDYSKIKKKYNYIFIFDVIEHLKDSDVKIFLDNCKKILKPKGLMFINVPSGQYLFSKYDEAVGHYRRYNKKSLNQTLEDSNYQIVNTSYWGFCLIPILILRKILVTLMIKKNVIKIGMNIKDNFLNKLIYNILLMENKLLKQNFTGTSLTTIVRYDDI